MGKIIKASACKCCLCGEPAVAFWPCIDPDIPQHPYCRKCLDREKLKAIVASFGEEEGRKLFNHWNENAKSRQKNNKTIKK